MNKIMRYIVLIGVIAWALWGLYPSYRWYILTHPDDQALIGMPAEELAVADVETRAYVSIEYL